VLACEHRRQAPGCQHRRYTLFTHLFAGYAQLNSDTYQVTIDPSHLILIDQFFFNRQLSNPEVKTLLSIAADAALFAAMAADPTKTAMPSSSPPLLQPEAVVRWPRPPVAIPFFSGPNGQLQNLESIQPPQSASQEKSCFGIPFHGWAWKLFNSHQHTLFAKADGAATGEYIGPHGQIFYSDVQKFIEDNQAGVEDKDKSYLVAYAYYETTWITYESESYTIADKIALAKTDKKKKEKLWIEMAEFVNAGYWLAGTDDTLPASNIDATLFTHLFVGYAQLNSDAHEVTVDPSQLILINQFSSTVKLSNPEVKTLLSIAGDTA
ncbi:hypothetical protein SDJN02_08699, partial [Cucurbita argyrosperma subsp. argyrosperma]